MRYSTDGERTATTSSSFYSTNVQRNLPQFPSCHIVLVRIHPYCVRSAFRQSPVDKHSGTSLPNSCKWLKFNVKVRNHTNPSRGTHRYFCTETSSSGPQDVDSAHHDSRLDKRTKIRPPKKKKRFIQPSRSPPKVQINPGGKTSRSSLSPPSTRRGHNPPHQCRYHRSGMAERHSRRCSHHSSLQSSLLHRCIVE